MSLTGARAATHRHLVLVGCVTSLLSSATHRPVEGGGNPNFTIPMHAKPSAFEQCNGYLPVDCMAVQPPLQRRTGCSARASFWGPPEP